MIAGLAAGLARHVDISPVAVRAMFVVLTFAGGAGVLLYVLGWLAVPKDGHSEPLAQKALRRGQDARPVLAVGMIVLGSLLLLRQTGLWFDDGVVWPVVLATMGLYVIWRQADDEDRAPLNRVAAVWLPRSAPAFMARVMLGSTLVASGIGVFLAANETLVVTRQAVVATVTVIAGLVLVFGPWWWRLACQLAEERRERIRSEERAEMAARVHDSVLQTLALIQRSAGDDRAVTHLARQQERELRSWLYSEPPDQPTGSLTTALKEMAADVEDLHGVTVEVITVGDCPLDERMEAVVQAAREALLNAVRHSGEVKVAVYAEVEAGQAMVFVRDRGAGFDPAEVGADRQGIAQSIVGRMERHGGTAVVRTNLTEGTEVELTMARAPR